MTEQPMQPISDPFAIELTDDQAKRLRLHSLALIATLGDLGLSSTILIHRLTDTSAFDVFPEGKLTEIGRQRSWDVLGDEHDLHLYLPSRS